MKRFVAAALCLAVLGAPAVAGAEPYNKHGKGPKGEHTGGPPHAGAHQNGGDRGGRDNGSDFDVDVDIIFGDSEIRTIRDYFRNNPYNAEALPPGIAMNLARGKPLPPGIAKRQLPEQLRHRLRYREGYEPHIVGNDIVLIATATGIIVDILRDAF